MLACLGPVKMPARHSCSLWLYAHARIWRDAIDACLVVWLLPYASAGRGALSIGLYLASDLCSTCGSISIQKSWRDACNGLYISQFMTVACMLGLQNPARCPVDHLAVWFDLQYFRIDSEVLPPSCSVRAVPWLHVLRPPTRLDGTCKQLHARLPTSSFSVRRFHRHLDSIGRGGRYEQLNARLHRHLVYAEPPPSWFQRLHRYLRLSGSTAILCQYASDHSGVANSCLTTTHGTSSIQQWTNQLGGLRSGLRLVICLIWSLNMLLLSHLIGRPEDCCTTQYHFTLIGDHVWCTWASRRSLVLVIVFSM